MRQNCSQVVIENFFEPCILFLLSSKPSYGYELNKNLVEECGCKVNIGSLYRCLNRLAKHGYVNKEYKDSKLGPAKRIYKITWKGKKLLTQWIVDLKTENENINKLIKNYEKSYETN